MKCEECETKDRCWERMIHGDQTDCTPIDGDALGELTITNEERLRLAHLLTNGSFSACYFDDVEKLSDKCFGGEGNGTVGQSSLGNLKFSRKERTKIGVLLYAGRYQKHDFLYVRILAKKFLGH